MKDEIHCVSVQLSREATLRVKGWSHWDAMYRGGKF